MRLRHPPSVRVLAAALLFGTALLTVPAAAPSPVAGIGPLPECRFDDIPTFPHDYDSGPTTLVDHLLTLGKGYVPPDLVPAGNAGVAGGGSVRRIAIDDLRAMADAAAENGTPLSNISSYRSYRQQRKLFNIYVEAYGYDKATTFSARPGHSEHQLGLTFDFVAPGDQGLTSNWEVTPTGGWMAENAWKYGWIMSFPKGKKAITCFRYEPWHYRYVGREVAAEIHDSGLTTREYLWEHYTMVDPATGEPVPSATVTPSTSASPGASPGAPTADASAPASLSNESAAPSTGPGAPTSPPSSEPVRWLGVDPPVLIVGLLLVLASIGLIASRSLRRGSRRR